MNVSEDPDWEQVRARLGPAALAAAAAFTDQAPETGPTLHAELAVLLRRHPNPQAVADSAAA